MAKNVVFLCFLLAILATSCTTSRFVAENTALNRASEVAYFEPFSYISVIEKGNTAIPNDSLSEVSAAVLDSIIKESKLFTNKRKIEIFDPLSRQNTEKDINYLFNNILTNRQIKTVKIPENLAQVLKSNPERYFMATIVSGFGRKAGNYGKQVAKGIGVGILTLGMVTPIPVKSNVSVYCCIIDAENMEVVYFSRTLPLEKSPTSRKVLTDRYRKVISEYFISK